METEILETVEPETESTIDTTTAYADLRAKYNMYIQTLFFQEKISASFEVKQLQDWLESIRGNHEEIEKARMNFQNLSVPIMKEQVSKKRHSVARLQAARSSNAISQQSFNEWITWLEDSNNDSQLVLDSMASTLTAYLDERKALASKRSVIKSKAFAPVLSSSDPSIKSIVAKITDDAYYFSLPIEKRKQLIAEATALIPVAANEQQLFANFKAQLDGALRDKVINETSYKRWVARFKNPNINSQARKYFVESQFPSYKQSWYRVQGERKDLLSSEALLKQMTDKDCKVLPKFMEATTFTALHFDEKESVIKQVRAAVAAKKTNREQLLKQVTTILQSQVEAGVMSSTKVGDWEELIMSDKKTLTDLQRNYIPRWKQSLRGFNEVDFLILEKGVPNGFNKLTKEKFLLLSTNQRESYVEMAKQTLRAENLKAPNTPMKDLQGKVRHAFATNDWSSAKHYLTLAWAAVETEEDRQELRVMEKYMREFEDTSDTQENADSGNAVQSANQEIETVLSLMPAALRPFYESALQRGAGCLQCVSTLVFNVHWCQARDFIPNDASEGKEEAREETAWRLKASGPGHGDGVENNRIDGFNAPAVRTEGWGPNNIFASPSEAETIAAVSDVNKDNFSYWYWGNLRVDNVSKAEYSYVSTALNHRIKRAARILQEHGKRYSATGPLFSVN